MVGCTDDTPLNDNKYEAFGLVELSDVMFGLSLVCLNCSSTLSPRDCTDVTTCASNEQCGVAIVGKRSNSNCSQCCQGDLCNAFLCGETDGLTTSGPVCYSCGERPNSDGCSKIRQCDRDQICESRIKATNSFHPGNVCGSICCDTNLCNKANCANTTITGHISISIIIISSSSISISISIIIIIIIISSSISIRIIIITSSSAAAAETSSSSSSSSSPLSSRIIIRKYQCNGDLDDIKSIAHYESIFINTEDKTDCIPGGIRTRDLWIRSPARYPLRYGDMDLSYASFFIDRSTANITLAPQFDYRVLDLVLPTFLIVVNKIVQRVLRTCLAIDMGPPTSPNKDKPKGIQRKFTTTI
ncbi:hypothetical protein MAR_004101 [Mya arenaria]|uniref:Uncharacterized protein n=1 Tax=Mya arenaria TaxID=6604 RepID=A0ABY7EYT1_MYAAR|nr:hypothetical protein MAR_004101 [Mya arenaria]